MKVNLPQDQLNQLQELKNAQEKVSKGWIDYWLEYSSFDTWQFWVNASFIIIPLIVLYFLSIERECFC